MGGASEHWLARLVFSIIFIIGICGNALVLWVYFKKRKTYKNTPFDLLIINLTVSDFLAAFFLVFSRFLYLPAMPNGEAAAFVHCNFFWGGYILFGLGYVSVYTCLVLTIERWLAIIKPHFFRRVKTKHTIRIIVVVWIWAFFINSTVFISVNENFKKNKCEWIDPKIGGGFFAAFELIMSCFLPFTAIVMMYTHIFYRIYHMKNLFRGTENVLKKRLTIIALMASIALIVGWLPAKISFMLRYTSVGGSHLHGTAHLIFIIMALGNCCVNPFLYGVYSSKFRKEYEEIFYFIFRKKQVPDDAGSSRDIHLTILPSKL